METHRIVTLARRSSTPTNFESLPPPPLRISLKKRNFSSISTSTSVDGKCLIGATIPPPVVPRSITPDILIPIMFEKHNSNALADISLPASSLDSQDKKKAHTPTIVGDNDDANNDANDGDYSSTKKQRNRFDSSATTISFNSSFSLYSSPRPRTTLKKPPSTSHLILVPTTDPVSVIRRQFSESLSTFGDSLSSINNDEAEDDIDININTGDDVACQQQRKQEGVVPRRVSFEEGLHNFTTPPPINKPPAFQGFCLRRVERKRLDF